MLVKGSELNLHYRLRVQKAAEGMWHENEKGDYARDQEKDDDVPIHAMKPRKLVSNDGGELPI